MTAAAVPTTRGRVLVDLLVTSRLAQISCVAAYVLAIAASAQLAVPLPVSPVRSPCRPSSSCSAPPPWAPCAAPWGWRPTSRSGRSASPGSLSPVGRRSVPRRLLRRGAARGAMGPRGWGSQRTEGGTAHGGGQPGHLRVGVVGLMAVTGMGLVTAIVAGVVPFLVGDALKIVAAAAALPATWRLVGKAGARQ